MNNKLPLLNYLFNKGLLLTVVLCYFYVCCSPPHEHQLNSIPSHKSVDSNFINPRQYLLFGNGKKANETSDQLSSEALALLQEGDILLRKGYGNVSEFIADFLNEPYPVTHCGFLVQNKIGQWNVIHTVSNGSVNGMFTESLASYCQQSQDSSLVLVRIKSDSAHISQIIQKAWQLVALQVPFDMAFDDKNSDQLYCIEMMRDLFLEVFGEDWFPLRKQQQKIDVLSMTNFFDSTRFEVLFNHLNN